MGFSESDSTQSLTDSRMEPDWNDVETMLAQLEQVHIEEKTVVKDLNSFTAFWTDAHSQFAEMMPPTCFTVTKRFMFHEIDEDHPGRMLIKNKGTFELLAKLKMKGAIFSVLLKFVGYSREMMMASEVSDCWKPKTPVPLRDVEYIIIQLVSSASSNGDSFSLSMCKVNDVVICNRLATEDLKCQFSATNYICLPGHPSPFFCNATDN